MDSDSLAEVEHNHRHICPSCSNELAEANSEVSAGRKNFICTNDTCTIEACICNGTFKGKSIEPSELTDKVKQIASLLEIDPYFDGKDVESIESFQEAVKEMVSENLDDVVVEAREDNVNRVLKEFDEIIESLQKREESSYLSPNGDELINIRKDIFVLKESILMYSIFYSDTDDPAVYQLPVEEDFPVYSKNDVSNYKVDVSSAVEEAGMLSQWKDT